MSGIGYGKRYNPTTDNLGFSTGQFETYEENESSIINDWESFIFVPDEAVERSQGKKNEIAYSNVLR